MDKEAIIDKLQDAKAYLNDVVTASHDDEANLNEAYIYISEAIDFLKEEDKEAAQ